MASFLDQFTKTSKVVSNLRQKMIDAGNWFRSNVGRLGGGGRKKEQPEKRWTREELLARYEKTEEPTVGSLVLFFYDPKFKKTLPYYDMFPLSIIVCPSEKGFHGLNTHYLHPSIRAKLFDALLDLSTDKKLTEKRRLELTYGMLKGSAKLKYFAPTYKSYLTSHIASKIVIVPPEDWSNVLFLPLQQFKKATDKEVWKDSQRKF